MSDYLYVSSYTVNNLVYFAHSIIANLCTHPIRINELTPIAMVVYQVGT